MSVFGETLERANKAVEADKRRLKEARIHAQKQKQEAMVKGFKLNNPIIDITSRGPLVSRAKARELAGHVTKEDVTKVIERLGGTFTHYDGTPMADGRIVAAACASDMVTEGIGRISIAIIRSPEGLDETPPAPVGDNEWNGLTNAWTWSEESSIRDTLQSKFRSACSELEDVKDVKFDSQPREVRLAAWAARDGDPSKGPADSLEDCFPLEIAFHPGSGKTYWIRHMSEDA